MEQETQDNAIQSMNRMLARELTAEEIDSVGGGCTPPYTCYDNNYCQCGDWYA